MRDLAVRTAVAVLVSAGLVLGGVGVASATDEDTTSVTTSGSATTTTTTTEATETTSATTTSESTTSTSTTSASTTSASTTSASTTSTSTTSASTTSASTTSSPSTTTGSTSPGEVPKASAVASRGCLGEITVVVTIPDLEVGTPFTAVVDDLPPTTGTVLEGGVLAIETLGLDPDLDVVGVTVLVGGPAPAADTALTGDMAYELEVPVSDVCTAAGTIVLVRDCTTPNQVLATVDVTGLTDDTTYGIAVVGETESGEAVVLASQDVQPVDGRLTGTLPLISLGPVPAEGFVGFALVIDGTTLASVTGDLVEVAPCVAPAPLPPAPLPVAPVAPVVVTTSSAAPTMTPAPHPTAGQLASTGSETGGLLLLAGVFLVLGGLTTMLARRTARS